MCNAKEEEEEEEEEELITVVSTPVEISKKPGLNSFSVWTCFLSFFLWNCRESERRIWTVCVTSFSGCFCGLQAFSNPHYVLLGIIVS